MCETDSSDNSDLFSINVWLKHAGRSSPLSKNERTISSRSTSTLPISDSIDHVLHRSGFALLFLELLFLEHFFTFDNIFKLFLLCFCHSEGLPVTPRQRQVLTALPLVRRWKQNPFLHRLNPPTALVKPANDVSSTGCLLDILTEN